MLQASASASGAGGLILHHGADKNALPGRFHGNPSDRGSAESGQVSDFEHRQFLRENVRGPDYWELESRVKECRNIAEGRQLHRLAIERGLLKSDIVLNNIFISMFLRCGGLWEARGVFDDMGEHDVASWSTMIKGYVTNEQHELALELFEAMEDATDGGCTPKERTFIAALAACSNLADQGDSKDRVKWLEKSKAIHSQSVMKTGLSCNAYLSSSLVSTYSKFGKLFHARMVFDEVVEPDTVSYNALIKAHAANGQNELALEIFDAMVEEGTCSPDDRTFLAVLSACYDLAAFASAAADEQKCAKWIEKGKAIYSQAVISNCSRRLFLERSLFSLFTRLGKTNHAQPLFDEMEEHDVLSWTQLIQCCSENAQNELALEKFSAMVEEGACAPNSMTLVVASSACARLAEEQIRSPKLMDKARRIHSLAAMSNLCDDHVQNSLVNLYAKLGRMDHSQTLFDGSIEPNVVCWTALIKGYIDNAQFEAGLSTFDAMAEAEAVCDPNLVTFLVVIAACAGLADQGESGKNARRWLEKGKAIHSWAVRSNCDTSFLKNRLVHMYAKFGKIDCAQAVFDQIGEPSVVSWTAMIGGFADCGEDRAALKYSALMDLAGIEHNPMTFVAVVRACKNLVDHRTGKEYHAEIQHLGFTQNEQLATCLIDFYGTCGCVAEARQVFDRVEQKSTAIWNALLKAYSLQGDAGNAFRLVEEMQKQENVVPDGYTFNSLLTACGHDRLRKKAMALIDEMQSKYGVAPSIEHGRSSGAQQHAA